jgi:hypothetical protein
MDQPAGLLQHLSVALNVYESVKAWYKSDDWDKFKKDYPLSYKVAVSYLKARNERTT